MTDAQEKSRSSGTSGSPSTGSYECWFGMKINILMIFVVDIRTQLYKKLVLLVYMDEPEPYSVQVIEVCIR